MDIDKILLYGILSRFGSVYELKIQGNVEKFMEEIKEFESNWVQYNPRKKINRYGLSITSLDGKLSGIPDLDSLKEYTLETGIKIIETDIITKTPVFNASKIWLNDISDHICRTHLIRLGPGGYFPMHRDNNRIEIDSFRLLVPLINCNPPKMFFILDKTPLNFNHGTMYFIDTCLEHTVFNASFSDSIFMVINVKLTKESVELILSKKSV